MKLYKTFFASAVLTVAATVVSAAPLTISSITAGWENAVPGAPAVTIDNGTGPGDNTVSARWGEPDTDDGPSGYDFTREATPLMADPEVDFILGTFTHINFPVFPPSLESIDLRVAVEIDGYANPIESLFSFTHDETTNSAPCAPGSVSVCDDIVTAALNIGASDSFIIGNERFFFDISGFQVNGTTFSEFMTEEGKRNEAKLVANFTTRPIGGQIPLPAAGWLLLGSLGVLGAVKRRRKAA